MPCLPSCGCTIRSRATCAYASPAFFNLLNQANIGGVSRPGAGLFQHPVGSLGGRLGDHEGRCERLLHSHLDIFVGQGLISKLSDGPLVRVVAATRPDIVHQIKAPVTVTFLVAINPQLTVFGGVEGPAQ